MNTSTLQEPQASETHACPKCLTRPRVLERLAPYIERALNERKVPSIRKLLAFDTNKLVELVGDNRAEEIVEESIVEDAEAFLAQEVTVFGCWAVCQHSVHYPTALKALDDKPAVIFGKGDFSRFAWLTLDDCVSVVGARRASNYGREVAQTLGRELGGQGDVVVSGMALGIDTAAHRGALESGLTVAVLANGANRAYPQTNSLLHRTICDKGLALSEMPPGARAWRWCFPARNRIIAGLSHTTVVVEAAERSGSMVTAKYAEEMGRTVAAVPGPVTSACSAGTNALIARGAKVVCEASDVA